MEKRKTAVIIAAAGKGTRMGGGIPKQFMKISGIPMIIRTIGAFANAGCSDRIFVVAGKDQLDETAKLVGEYGLADRVSLVEGGARRQDSIYAGLKAAAETDAEYVLIHDGARPFIHRETILAVLDAAEKHGAAVAAVPVKDSMRRSSGAVDREGLYSVQTPQGFRMKLILFAYEKAEKEGFEATDDATVAENAGFGVEIVDGTYDNIKVTTKEDMPMEMRAGTGFDVHGFTEGRPLVLGGVTIPYDKGLEGHSDADVLTHAVMDALLGAASAGDIGKHFPDTEDSWKNVSSMIHPEKTKEIIKNEGYTPSNIDVTLIAERPKISAYTETMEENIAKVLGIDKSAVSVKATTTEGLGFTGRGEGIAAQAVCMINK